MSLLQEMETHGLADCEFNRQLLQEAFKHSPYEQVHIKDWACMAEAKAFYLEQGFKQFDTVENERDWYYILRKGLYEVMVSRVGFLNVKSSLIRIRGYDE